MIFSLLLLPQILDWNISFQVRQPYEVDMGKKSVLVILSIACIAFILSVPHISADFSLKSIDGTPSEYTQPEEDFSGAWRMKREPYAAVIAAGISYDDGIGKLKQVNEQIKNIHPPLILPPCPTNMERRQNRSLWQSAEVKNQIQNLEHQVQTECMQNGLPPVFFDPFFEKLKSAIEMKQIQIPDILKNIESRMVRENNGKTYCIAFMEDSGQNVSSVRDAIRRTDSENCTILSKEGFRQFVYDDFCNRFQWIFALSLISALMLSFVMLRKIRDVILSFLPVCFSLCGVGIISAAAGFTLTPA